jgi:hypothetical protein
MTTKMQKAAQEAKRTGIWAKTMTKWLITHAVGNKRWKFVSFEGGQEGANLGRVAEVLPRVFNL